MLRTHAPDAQRADELAEGVVVVRHEVTYVAPLAFRFRPVSIECWVTEIRAARFTMAYEIFDEDADGERHGLPAGQDRADAVRLRHRAAAPAHRRRADGARAVPRADEPVPAVAGSPGRATAGPGHYPVHVRFSDVDVYGHVNNVKYFEYFQEARIPLHRADLGESLDAGDHRRGGPDRRRLQGADPVPARAVRRAGRGSPTSGSGPFDHRVGDLRRRDGCSPGRGSCSSSSTRRRQRSTGRRRRDAGPRSRPARPAPIRHCGLTRTC